MLPKSSLLALAITALLIGSMALTASAAGRSIGVSQGTAHTPGVLRSGGNAGTVNFGGVKSYASTADQASFPGVTINSSNQLSGYFWIETLGWAKFITLASGATPELDYATLTPPTARLRDPWLITSGGILTQNAGYIELTKGTTYAPSATGVAYLPDTQSFGGFAYAPDIGYIDFASLAAYASIDGNTTATQLTDIGGVVVTPGSVTPTILTPVTPVTPVTDLGQSLGGKVKILGLSGGANTYDLLTIVSSTDTLKGVSRSSILGGIKRSLATATRGITAAGKTSTYTTGGYNFASVNGVVYYAPATDKDLVITGATLDLLRTAGARTIVTSGVNIMIESNIAKDALGTDAPIALVALADEVGAGGNIYIKSTVDTIYATLIADGSLLSGETKTVGWSSADKYTLYNKEISQITSLPTAQLAIYGSLISANTIGGAAKDPSTCGGFAYLDPLCESGTMAERNKAALKYDLIYFRSHITGGAEPRADYADYSLIIDSDARVTRNPPPGLTLAQ